MQNLSEDDIKHLIEIHEEAIAKLKLQVSPRPEEPKSETADFPPVVGFVRPIPGIAAGDPQAETPFVAIRYANACWFINRGGGGSSQALSWDGLLDWIGADYWHTIKPLFYTRINATMAQPGEFGCSNDGHHANCKCGA